MTTLTINVDEADELNIQATEGTTFELDVDVKRPLEGTVNMELALPGATTVAVEIPATIVDTRLHFRGHHTQMTFPTGVYRYVIVLLVDNTRRNLLFGQFTFKPLF